MYPQERLNLEKSLLDIGSCGLHTVHGSLRDGHKASGWNLKTILRAFYYHLNDCPARKADYIRITGSEKFALRYCGHRWVENAPVVERLLEVLPLYRLYAARISPKPDASSFATIQRAIKDDFLEAKLHFL